MSSTGRADGPSNPGDGGEERFEEAEGVGAAPVPDTNPQDPAEGTAEGTIEPPD
ncbi:MAG TPA: hypothetical protein VIL55_02600 [Naasia sp.]|jgi:hypothetical protein